MRVQVIRHTPPSLFALFENFDCCIRLGRPPQRGAGGGLLVGVAVNGVPLAEAPVLEIYGPTQLIYSSAEEAEDSVVRRGGTMGGGGVLVGSPCYGRRVEFLSD